MQYPNKNSFWDQPTDGALYKYLFVRLLVGIVVGTRAWAVGHFVVRHLIVEHLVVPQ